MRLDQVPPIHRFLLAMHEIAPAPSAARPPRHPPRMIRLLLALGIGLALIHTHPAWSAVTPASPDTGEAPVRKKPRPKKTTHPDGARAASRGKGVKGHAADPKPHSVPALVAPLAAPKPAVKPGKDPAEPSAKLPRFAALKTDETNMRVGPGQRYPIEWVYRRRDLPVEVEREYDVWRYVRDPEGVRGWVHQVTLSERRTFVVKDADATIRTDANDAAKPVAVLKVGVIGRLKACDEGSKWCQVQSGPFKGYLRREQFWGLFPNEVVTAS